MKTLYTHLTEPLGRGLSCRVIFSFSFNLTNSWYIGKLHEKSVSSLEIEIINWIFFLQFFFFSEIEEDISSYSISHTATEGERLPKCIASIAASEATNVQSKNVMEDRTVLSEDFTSLGMLLTILVFHSLMRDVLHIVTTLPVCVSPWHFLGNKLGIGSSYRMSLPSMINFSRLSTILL